MHEKFLNLPESSFSLSCEDVFEIRLLILILKLEEDCLAKKISATGHLGETFKSSQISVLGRRGDGRQETDFHAILPFLI